MHTFTITVAPNGKFLFRIENIDGQKLAFDIAKDMAKVYGEEAIRLAWWTVPTGTQIPSDVWKGV